MYNDIGEHYGALKMADALSLSFARLLSCSFVAGYVVPQSTTVLCICEITTCQHGLQALGADLPSLSANLTRFSPF